MKKLHFRETILNRVVATVKVLALQVFLLEAMLKHLDPHITGII
jgi:hypothetical protein